MVLNAVVVGFIAEASIDYVSASQYATGVLVDVVATTHWMNVDNRLLLSLERIRIH
jgi:hypothetical protein